MSISMRVSIGLNPARLHVVEELGFNPGQASPTTRYGVSYLERLGLGWVGRYSWGPAHTLCLADRVCNYRADPWAAAVVLASLVVEHPKAKRLDRTALLAAATLTMAGGYAQVEQP